MRGRRLGIVIGGMAIATLVGLAVYLLLVLRRCDDVHDVRRGSFDYRLCGTSSEFIAKVPIVAAAGEPTYSWRQVDGNKTGYARLRYESAAAPDSVRATLEDFLRRSGFAVKSTDNDYEWWTDHDTDLGLAVRGVAGGSRVEILHDTGY